MSIDECGLEMPCSYYFKESLSIKRFNTETKEINFVLDTNKLNYKLSEPIYVKEGSILLVTHLKGQIGFIDKKNSVNSISDFFIEPFDKNVENRSLTKIDQMLTINCQIDNVYYLHEIKVIKKYYILIPYDIRIKLAKSTKNIKIKLDENQSK